MRSYYFGEKLREPKEITTSQWGSPTRNSTNSRRSASSMRRAKTLSSRSSDRSTRNTQTNMIPSRDLSQETHHTSTFKLKRQMLKSKSKRKRKIVIRWKTLPPRTPTRVLWRDLSSKKTDCSTRCKQLKMTATLCPKAPSG